MQQENLNRLYIERFNVNRNELIEMIKVVDSNFFLLIDTAKNHNYFKKWLKCLTKKQIAQIGNLFEGTIDESSPLEVSPLLVRLNEENIEMICEKLLITENVGMFSVIQTQLSKQSLILHLQPFLQAEMPTGELALFRFYDPSIVKVLNRMLNQQDFSDLLAPIENWWFQGLDDCFNNIVEA